MPLAPSLDTIGILARSAIDIAPVWTALSGQPRDELRPVAVVSVIEGALSECDANIVALFRAAVAELAGLGVAVESRAGFPESADRASMLVMQAEAARAHKDLIESGSIDPVLRKRLGKGLAISDDDLELTLRRRAATRDCFVQQFLGRADVALLPVMPTITPRYEETDPASPAFNPKVLYALSRFTRFVNYLGLPALAVPMGFDRNGMPAGMQMIGRLGSEPILLDFARRYQEATNWTGLVPAGIASK